MFIVGVLVGIAATLGVLGWLVWRLYRLGWSQGPVRGPQDTAEDALAVARTALTHIAERKSIEPLPAKIAGRALMRIEAMSSEHG